ncbi:MAG: site-2 protease family protein [Candidatus Omnitrophica bacterium]|nr:site-2 protease family protein [Candidatus Omnitrophota bacterium]
MNGNMRLTRIMGIDIDIHFTFFLLLILFFFLFGPKGLALIIGVFIFVTIHELCHSLVAMRFGVKVKRITLLPIGGVASLSQMPTKPYQEFLISIAGPLSNLVVVVVFYYPMCWLLGRDVLMYPLMVILGRAEYTGQLNVWAHVYWINLLLAGFNMIPAFPMDGGRVLRALLSSRMSYRDATKIAVRLGHIFALLFAYFGIVYGHIFLVIIAVFIYIAASNEISQVEMVETIKSYSVQDVLATEFVYVNRETPLFKVLEMTFHTHQEDFPVIEEDKLVGFVTRREIIYGLHEKGKDAKVGEVMRTDIPPIYVNTKLHIVQKLMQKFNTSAMPVIKEHHVAGVITLNDINRVYVMMHEK